MRIPPDEGLWSQLVESAHAEGRATWPGVALQQSVFGAHLTRLAVEPDDLRTRGGDLFLAAGCLAGDPGALLAFEQSYLEPVPRLLTRLSLRPHQQDELRQQLRIKLLVGPPPLIAEYRGMGPLGAWVRICAFRLALDLKLGSEHKQGDSDALEALIEPEVAREVTIDAGKHREAFNSALQEALATLTARDKTLLRLHFLDGMNIDALGVLFRVHRATVARWLVTIRGQVLERVRQQLSMDLGASPSEARSLIRVFRSDVQLSIRRMLDDSREE
jgi:RNA polymerase sigma-70 factor, ECF subfamily